MRLGLSAEFPLREIRLVAETVHGTGINQNSGMNPLVVCLLVFWLLVLLEHQVLSILDPVFKNE